MNNPSKKIILAIETSCDETAAAVLVVDISKKWPEIKTLSSVVKSQINIHKSFGGVVPEAAARAHLKNIRPVVERALSATPFSSAEASAKAEALSAIDYIAVTHGPGLIPSLLVGVEFAKALSFGLKKPMIPVNHMLGHLYSPFAKQSEKSSSHKVIKSVFPMISLIVSGGHTILVLMKDEKNYKVLGQTVDDAAGEAFDKVAKLLKLPYPGGPEVSKLAEKGNPEAINFPSPMIHHKNYNFSFSGLKTAVLYHLRGYSRLSFPRNLSPTTIGERESNKIDSDSRAATASLGRNDFKDICASFQQAVVDVLVTKTLRAAKEFKAKSISLSGGVAANVALRTQLNLKSKISHLKFFVPPINLCTDNAEMIGLAAAFMLHNGYKPKSYKQVKANPNLEL